MKLLRNLFLLFLVLLVVGGIVLALLPARFALDFVGGRLGPVELGEVSGTVWRGEARPARVNGEDIGTLSWSLSPWALFAARVDADLRLEGEVWRGDGSVSVKRDRSVRVRDLHLNFPAQRLQPALDIPALVLRGEVQVHIVEGELLGGFPTAVKGTATWKDAAVAGSAAAQFGDLSTDFASDGAGGLKGTLRDSGGPLQAQGGYQASLAGYSADVVLRARDGNPQVIEALQYIGQPQPDGSARLEVRGQLLGGF
jgi:general secretion pathway protein N